MVWVRRLVPMGVGAGLLYLAWRVATANAAPVTIELLVARFTLPLWQALGASFLLGAGVLAVYTLYQGMHSRLVLRRYRKRLRDLEAEVHQLRNLPLAAAEAAAPPDELEPGTSRERIRGAGS